MLSVKKGLQCIGKPNGQSIVSDLFGYVEVPKRISLRKQLELLQGTHYHVNVICVAQENFPSGSFKKICNALQVTREIYEKVNMGIGRIEWFNIDAGTAGNKAIIDDSNEAWSLTSDWTVANDGLDLFVVRDIIGADGWSPLNGWCDKNNLGMTGSVVSLKGSDGNIANTFAHEMGHYLGLDHIQNTTNFIGDTTGANTGASNSNTGILDSQGDILKMHCFMKNGCQIS